MVEEDLQAPALYTGDGEAFDALGCLEVDHPLGQQERRPQLGALGCARDLAGRVARIVVQRAAGIGRQDRADTGDGHRPNRQCSRRSRRADGRSWRRGSQSPEGQGPCGQDNRAEDERRPGSSGRRCCIPHTAASNPCFHVLTSFHRIVGYYGFGGREDWVSTDPEDHAAAATPKDGVASSAARELPAPSRERPRSARGSLRVVMALADETSDAWSDVRQGSSPTGELFTSGGCPAIHQRRRRRCHPRGRHGPAGRARWHPPGWPPASIAAISARGLS